MYNRISYRYMSPLDIDAQTLTSGTVYYTLFNFHTRVVGINRAIIQVMSSTGSGNTHCKFSLARIFGTGTTGGTLKNISKMDTNSPTPNVICRSSTTGLTLTGNTIEAYFMEIAIRTGSDGHTLVYDFDGDDGLILSPGEGIAILADGDMVSGATLHGSIEFSTIF